MMLSKSASEVEKLLEQCYYDIATEGRLSRVGLKERQETAPILERFKALYEPDQIASVRLERDAATGDRQEELTRVYNALLDGFIDMRTASLNDDLITSLSMASTEIDGQGYAFYDLVPAIARESDPMKRERLLAGMVDILAPRDALYDDQRKATLSAINEAGFNNYYDFYRVIKGVDYPGFTSVINQAGLLTEALYEQHMGAWVQSAVGQDLGNVSCAHFYWLRGNQVEADLFPADRMEGALRDTLTGMGIDLDRQTNIHIDSEQRPTKNPRACVIPARVPGEVHLIIKPTGGKSDYDAFFHEAGHAEHFAETNPALPFAFRMLGRTMAHTELFSYLMENLINDPMWLQTHMNLSEDQAHFVSYRAALMDLGLFRRYCAKFLYEYSYFTGGGDGPSLYSLNIQQFTGFVYPKAFWQYDRDAGFYSADYLRAWFGHASVRGALQDTYGPTWWSDPAAGTVIRDLWHAGSQPDIEDVVLGMGGKPWDTETLARYYHSRIADSPAALR